MEPNKMETKNALTAPYNTIVQSKILSHHSLPAADMFIYQHVHCICWDSSILECNNAHLPLNAIRTHLTA